MDKLIFDNIDKGFERSPRNLETLQRSFLQGFDAILQAVIDDYDSAVLYRVHGCEITVDGSDYETTSGVVFFNGELFAVPAAAFTSPAGS